ncbi:MAG: DMT family transporter [Burkholderiales bacterium]
MDTVPIVFALVAGFCTALEQTINARLGREITPGLATLHNLLIGALFMLLINVLRGNIANYAKITKVSPLLMVGGIFGALIIYLSSRSIPIIGVTATLTLIIAGQLACGIITDVLFSSITFSAAKWIGIALVTAGVYLIMRQ